MHLREFCFVVDSGRGEHEPRLAKPATVQFALQAATQFLPADAYKLHDNFH